MANVRLYSRSFAGGEVSVEMWGRIDDGKYQTGLAECRNFLVRPQGPVENRCGTHMVNEAKYSGRACRLIPFVYNNDQTMVIELGHLYARFHTLGATLMSGSTPYEIATPFTEDTLFEIHYVQSADVMTLVHPRVAPQELRRLGALNWVMAPIDFAPPAAPPSASATATVATGMPPTIHYSYVVTWIRDSDGAESLPSAEALVDNNLYITGNLNTITWPAVVGAREYLVYKMQGGMHGYIGRTAALSLVDENIAPDMSRTPPKYDGSLAANAPGAVSYFEQRRVFAGATDRPQQVWMTKTGTESGVTYSVPVRDDDRISFRVAAREVNMIRHVVPLDNLMLLTSAGEWRVTSVNSDAITPSTISVKPQSFIGANQVQPLVVNRSVLFAAARGGHMYELGYNWQANGYITGDMSLRNAALFDDAQIVDLAYSKAPYPVAWAVSSRGDLLGMTYVPEQQVGAWHVHTTKKGAFESVCTVPEGPIDAVYVVVHRTLASGARRFVERMAYRAIQLEAVPVSDAYFVDCGITRTGTPTMVVGGLTHLKGETVSIVADGRVLPQQVVDNDGIVYLDQVASVTSVGLPIDAYVRTLPVAAAVDNAFGQGRGKNVGKVWVKIQRTGWQIHAGQRLDRMSAVRARQYPGASPALYTDEVEIPIEGWWVQNGGQFYVQQREPMPMTILGLTAEVTMGG